MKRLFEEKPEDSPIKSVNLGWNTPQNGIAGPPIWSIPPLLPTSCSLGALLEKLPSVMPSYNAIEAPDSATLLNNNNINSANQRVQFDNGGIQITDIKQEEKSISTNHNLQLGNRLVGDLGSRSLRDGESALNLN